MDIEGTLLDCPTQAVPQIEETMMSRSSSRNATEARRRRATLQNDREGNTRREAVRSAAVAYRPSAAVADGWPDVSAVVIEVLSRVPVTGAESLRKHITHVTHFYVWALDQGIALEAASLNRTNVETYISTGMAHSSAKSRADRRSRLRPIADHLHPEQAPSGGAVIARPSVKAPYTPEEMSAIQRSALGLPRGQHRTRLCLCVGLGAGAGLGPADFRGLRRHHLEDLGPEGVFVTVPGARTRRVPVLQSYEQLIRAGLPDLGCDDLVVGGGEHRKNLTARVVEDAGLLDDCPYIEQSRLRHTWLAHMLQSAIPLPVLLKAAGLNSARTLTDLARLLPPPPVTANAVLRTAEVPR